MTQGPTAIRSMTGFGSATAHAEGAEGHVELRSVNNRYFKVSMRLSESLQPLEAEIEIALRRRIMRGTVTVRASFTESADRAAQAVNAAALRRYAEEIRLATAGVEGVGPLDPGLLVSLPGVLRPPADEDERAELARGVVMPLVELACDRLIEMRRREGESLGADLLDQHAAISARLERIAELAPGVARQYERRLIARIESLLQETGATLEPQDLVREVAVYADRSDIHEEIKRLRAHLEQFERRVRRGDEKDGHAVGRTLEFLGQEMLREANTMASKSPDAEVSTLAVEIKSSIDRIKEQVQNAE